MTKDYSNFRIIVICMTSNYPSNVINEYTCTTLKRTLYFEQESDRISIIMIIKTLARAYSSVDIITEHAPSKHHVPDSIPG